MTARTAFLRTSAIVVAVSLIYNGLSVYQLWFAPGCADCELTAGVPFPFVRHGGFFTQTQIIWEGVRNDFGAIAATAIALGAVAALFVRRKLS
jgi:hypothetical protein